MKLTIENPKQFIRILYKELEMYFKKELEYRWQVFVWVISDLLQPLLLCTVWLAVARQGGILSVPQTVTYFFLVVIVSKLTKDWSVTYMTNSILSGEFSKYLLKPFNYLAETLGISLGARVLRITFLIPVLSIVGLIFHQYLSFNLNPLNISLALLALILAFFINFLLGNTFALVGFFVTQILGLRAFYEHVAVFLSGEAMPLIAYPEWSKVFLNFLPYRYTLSFPIEILMGTTQGNDMFFGFAVSIAWIIILMLLFKIMFKMSVKRNEAYGI